MTTLQILPRFCYLLIVLWISGYFYFLNLFNFDIAYGDDFELFLHFWIKYQDATSISEKIAILFDQFVEHRLMFTRLVYFILVKMGIGNIKFVVLIGNSFLVLLLWIFHSVLMKHHKLPIYYLLPVTFLIFQPCYSFDGMIWAAAMVAYIPVSVFSILTIYLLWQNTNRTFWVCLVIGFFTVYAFGNGQLVLVTGLLVLGVQRRWKSLIIWTVFATITLATYYYRYEVQHGRPNIFLNILNQPYYIFINILVFLGGFLEQEEGLVQLFSRRNILSTSFGIGVILTFFTMIHLCIKSYFQTKKIDNLPTHLRGKLKQVDSSNIFWLGAILFFIISAGIFAISRTETDAIYSHINRYRIHSICAVILCYGFIILSLRQNLKIYFLRISIILSLLFSTYSYYYFYYWISDNTRNLQTGLHNWHHEKQWMIYRETAYWENASRIISTEFEEKYSDVYQFPKGIFEKIDTSSNTQNIKIRMVRSKNARLVFLSDLALSGNFQTPTDGIYLSFKSKYRTYLFSTHLIRSGLKQFIATKNYYQKGFFLELNTQKIPIDKYDVGIIIRENDRNTFMKTGQVVDFTSPFSRIF
jgi:hypothetical protein